MNSKYGSLYATVFSILLSLFHSWLDCNKKRLIHLSLLDGIIKQH